MTRTGQLEALFGRRRFAIKPGIERILALLAQYGNPERRFATLHVVGTNGKGSTAAFIAGILVHAGYRTGLFTSPHLVSYRERFQLNGMMIAQERLDQLIIELLDHAPGEVTFFELTTALACRWFAESDVEIAVVEAGMGGRHDATAALSGIATVVTPISLDHCQWLGNSLEAIAAEKISITVPGSPVIAAEQPDTVHAILERHCRKHGNPLMLAGRDFTAQRNADGTLQYTSLAGTVDYPVPGLQGRYQTGNAATALAAVEQLAKLGFPVDQQAMRLGIAAARWPGRFERISLEAGVDLLLDGAHNPAGSRALAESLKEQRVQPITLLLGMMADKDLPGILEPLLSLTQQVFTAPLAQERAVSPESLATLCSDRGRPAQAVGSLSEALTAACAATAPGGLIVAAGSLFLVGELKALLAGTASDAVRG